MNKKINGARDASALTAKRRGSFIFKIVLGLIFVSPLIIGVVFSFVPNNRLYTLPSLDIILKEFTLDNYRWVYSNVSIVRYIINSLIVCAVAITVQITIGCMSAYAFSYFNFKGRDLLFNIVLVSMMIPGQVTVIANYLLIQDLNLANSYLGLSITSFVGGTSIFMLRQYFLQLPYELRQAAAIDGCGDMGFLLRIAVPCAVPVIASLVIYLFIGIYNQYLWPMLVATRTDMQTIQIGMSMLVGEEVEEYGHVLAGAVISVIVPIVIFIIGQDYMVKGMTAGAIKG